MRCKKIHDDTEPNFSAVQTDLTAITNTLNDHTQLLNDHTQILNDHTKCLERNESILWQGQWLDEIERRAVKLAEIVGAADLATPFSRPIGV